MTRKAGFFHRAPGGQLGCPECGFIIDHIPEDWLERHVSESMGCPACALSSRIPTHEEADWMFKKHRQDSRYMVPVPDREQPRLITNEPIFPTPV